MESQAQLNEKIARISAVIRENYPELSQHLNEMPVAVFDDSSLESVNENLSNYYDSLLTLFRKYVSEHQLQNSNRVYKDHHL